MHFIAMLAYHLIKRVLNNASKLNPQLAEHLPLRIRLAEDNVTNQKIALLLLQRIGYRADVAANSLEVL